MKTKPFKAVDFSLSAITKALNAAGSLIVDIKYDGVRGNLLFNPDGTSAWLSREAKVLPGVDHMSGFVTQVAKTLSDDRNPFPQGLMLDVEFLVKGVDFNTGSGLLRTMYQEDTAKKSNIKYSINPEVGAKKSRKVPFGLLPELLEARVIAVLPIEAVESGEDYPVNSALMQYHTANMVSILRDRFPQVDWRMTESKDVFSIEELNDLYEDSRAAGYEGLLIKDPLCNYKRGKKSGWWKMKPEGEIDGTICGLVWGTEGLANEGKVIGFEVLLENGRVVNATNITQALMDEFTENVKRHRCLETAFDNKPGEYYHGWAVQVKFMEETPDGSLRHPSFEKFRGTESDPYTKV